MNNGPKTVNSPLAFLLVQRLFRHTDSVSHSMAKTAHLCNQNVHRLPTQISTRFTPHSSTAQYHNHLCGNNIAKSLTGRTSKAKTLGDPLFPRSVANLHGPPRYITILTRISAHDRHKHSSGPSAQISYSPPVPAARYSDEL